MLVIRRSHHPGLAQPAPLLAAPLSLLLIALLLLQMAPPLTPRPFVRQEAPPSLAEAARASAVPAAPAPPLPDALAGKPELTAARGPFSAFYDMGEGRYAMLQDSQPLHYRDEAGAWQPINPAFAPTVGGWINSANSVQTGLSRRSSEARVFTTGAGLVWEPRGLLVSGAGAERTLAAPLAKAEATPGVRSRDGAAVRYPAGWSLAGLQDQWRARRGGSEYTMRLPALPDPALAAPEQLELSVLLRLHPGTALHLGGEPAALPAETTGPIEFVGAGGEPIQLMPPLAYEQASPQTMTPGSYLLRATADPQTVELRLRLPWAWLAAPERQFPVIIDPLFQIRTPMQAVQATYKVLDGGQLQPFQLYTAAPPRMVVDARPDFVRRLLVRFPQPAMPRVGVPAPNGTNITAAYIAAVPTWASGEQQRTFLSAHAITGDNWWVDPQIDDAPPSFEAAALPASANGISYSASALKQPAITWTVTELARTWLSAANGIGDKNLGVLIRPFMDSMPAGCTIIPAHCGTVEFDNQAGSWSEGELEATEAQSAPDRPVVPASEGGGIRLLVFYEGPTLAEGQVISSEELNGAPPPASTGGPFWNVDHVYRVPPTPGNRWQAVVVRGLGNPRADQGGGELTWQHPLSGTLRLSLGTSGGFDDPYSLVQAPPGEVGFIAINGRGGKLTDENTAPLLLRVDEPQGNPADYDVRLIKEDASLSTAGNLGRKVGPTIKNVPTSRPMVLVDLDLPPSTNSTLYVTIATANTPYASYAQYFQARIIESERWSHMPAAGGAYASTLEDVPLIRGLGESGFIQRGSDGKRYAMAITYNGPRLYTPPPPPPPPSLVGDGEVIDLAAEAAPEATPPPGLEELRFDIRVQAVTCQAGSFPTSDGACQAVECPAPNAAYYRAAGGIGMWAPAGWTEQADGATSVYNPTAPGAAPLLGAPNPGSPSARVAVIGGTVGFSAGTGAVSVGPNSKVTLIRCDGDALSPTSFQAYHGAMARALSGSTPVLRPNPSNADDNPRPNLYPWDKADKPDLSQERFEVQPALGLAVGEARVRRRLDSVPPFANDQLYDGKWWVSNSGWNALGTSLGAVAGNPDAPPVASLNLDLKGPFSLDFSRGEKVFVAVRARGAVVTQQATFGGASKPVQALLMGRNRPADIQAAPSLCPGGSCLDLRAPDDTVAAPNRVWALPDIHTNVQAGTMIFSREGETLVFSEDHPDAQLAGASQSFSFDVYKASVSVTEEQCIGPSSADYDPDAPKVTVIRGEGRMALPNIGGGDSPDAAISAGFRLCAEDGDPNLRNVHFAFSSPIGIPIGSTGMFLTAIGGTVDIFPTHTRVELDLHFQGGQGGDSIFSAWGKVIIDTDGLFEFQGGADILGTVSAQGRLWVAWNPLDIGVDVSISIGSWLTGSVYAHMWQGQGWQNRYSWLPDNDEMHMTGRIAATLSIEEGAIVEVWEAKLPPFDISIGVELSFGQFCTSDDCREYEWGVKGKIIVLGASVGVYYGFEEGLDFILGGDDHILIDQFGTSGNSYAGALAAASEEGLNLQAAPPTLAGVAMQPLDVSERAESFLVGLAWLAGGPQLTLLTPEGVEVTPANAAQHGAEFYTSASQRWVGVKAPRAGQWQARISGLSAEGVERYQLLYFANRGAPGAAGASALAADDRLTLTPRQGGYTISWAVPAGATPQHRIALYYRHTQEQGGPLHRGVPITENQPYTGGSFAWDTLGMRNGEYEVYAVVSDGQNALPAGEASIPDDTCVPLHGPYPRARTFDPQRFAGTDVFTATQRVTIADTTAPAVPPGFQFAAVDGAIMARLPAPAAPGQPSDITHYRLLWGPRITQNTFIVRNTMLVGADEGAARLVAVDAGVEYGVRVQALDANGNASPLTFPAWVTVGGQGDAVPFAPAGLQRAGGGSTSVDLSWSPAAGGPAPAGYRVRYTRVDVTPTVPGELDTASTGATLTGLATGGTYDVTVAAANAGGWHSAASATLRVVVTDGADGSGDGLPDDWAAAMGLAPGAGAQGDADADGLSNLGELKAGSHPRVQDSDGDGLSDAEEAQDKSDALRGNSYTANLRQPRLAVAEDTLTFRIRPGSSAALAAAPAQQVAWANAGGGTLQLTATPEAPWITASVSGNTLQVGVREGLAPGFYSGVVRLNQAAADPLIGAPKCVRVRAWVYPEAGSSPSLRVFLPLIRR